MSIENIVFVGLLFIPVILISFIITLYVLPKWIKRAKIQGLSGKDVHKKKPIKVAEGGGIPVLAGFVVSVFLYIAIRTFVFNDNRHLVQIFGLMGVLFFASMVGLLDDLLGWKKGLSKKSRLLLILFSAVPLMALNAGESILMGIDFGLLYPLLIVPIAVVGATTTFNFLAGYNGLESSQGIIILTALSVVNFISGNWWLALITMSYVAALVAFWFFNKYPAKIFPGDVLTYSTGAMIACNAILGNIEKIALFFFIPYILEVFLKARGKFEVESFGAVQEDGSLKLRQKKICGLEHLAIQILRKIKPSKKAYEWEIPMLINLFQIVIIIIGFILLL